MRTNANIQTKINEFHWVTETNVERDLIQAHELYEMRRKIYSLNQEAVQVAKLNLISAKEKYELGVINSFNFRDVNMTYLNAGISVLESLYNLIDSKTELTRLTGGLVQQPNAE